MANYANTKSTIAANVYQNGNQEVTANMVKTAINEVVDTLIAGGYLYAGVAHPADAAVSPDANVFYLASEAGTYTNKGGLVVADGEVAVLKYNGTWSKEVTGMASVSNLFFDKDERTFTIMPGVAFDYYETGGIKAGDTIKIAVDTNPNNADIVVYANNGGWVQIGYIPIGFVGTYSIKIAANDYNFIRLVPNASASISGRFEYVSTSQFNNVPDKIRYYVGASVELFVGENREYKEIYEALNAINDDRAERRYIIYVDPGVYQPFSMWSGVGRVRYISIIGKDPNNTIVFSNKGNYNNPPAEICTNGVIENITFENIATPSTYVPSSFAYAAHIDYASEKLLVRNCRFICNAGPAVGIGLHQDETIEFDSCRFECAADGTFNPGGPLSAFFVHSSVTPGTTGQRLIVSNCLCVAKYEQTGAYITRGSEEGEQGSEIIVELRNSGFFGSNGASLFILDGYLSGYSFGNVPSNANFINP